jgi:hypothetical protein
MPKSKPTVQEYGNALSWALMLMHGRCCGVKQPLCCPFGIPHIVAKIKWPLVMNFGVPWLVICTDHAKLAAADRIKGKPVLQAIVGLLHCHLLVNFNLVDVWFAWLIHTSYCSPALARWFHRLGSVMLAPSRNNKWLTKRAESEEHQNVSYISTWHPYSITEQRALIVFQRYKAEAGESPRTRLKSK